MNISFSSINTLLREEDIEGLIVSGAPADEYSSEAEAITSAIAVLKDEQRTEATIIAIISLVWAKAFSRSPQEIEARMPVFRNMARQILN